MPRPRSYQSKRSPAPPSADGYRTVRAAVDSGNFAPVYLMHGEDDFLKNDSLKTLIEAAVEPSTRDFNLEFRSAESLDAETLGSILGTPPAFAPRRAIVIKDVHQLKKAAKTQLDKYLETPANDTLLVLLLPAGETPDADLVRKSTACVFDRLSPERVRKWIAYYASSNLGISITSQAAELLEQSAGNDLQQLSAELDKCASHVSGKRKTDDNIEIDEETVADIVGVKRGETVIDLLDAMAMRNTSLALGILPLVLSNSRENAVRIVMLLGVQMLGIAWARSRRDEGIQSSRLKSEILDFIKNNRLFVSRPWGEAASTWATAQEKWTAEELNNILRILRNTDLALKDTRISNDEQLMTSLILSMGASKGRNRA